MTLPSVTVSEEFVVIEQPRRGRKQVARILARTTTADGMARLTLDRLVHGPLECAFQGWSVSGAVVSVLVEKLISPV